MHPHGPPLSWREHVVTFLAIVLGFTLVFALAALVLQ